MTEKPTGMTSPPSAEYMLPIVRQRLHDLEEAVEAFLSVMETTGKEREAAYKGVKTFPDRLSHVTAFLDVYERTFAPRLEAFQKLHNAMQMDFRTALLCAPDTTDAHLEKWMPKLEEGAE